MTAKADQSPSGARPGTGLDAKHASGGAQSAFAQTEPANNPSIPPNSRGAAEIVQAEELPQPLSQHVPTRLWLLDLGGGDITWCDDPDPDGEQVDAVEYVRVEALTKTQDRTDPSPAYKAMKDAAQSILDRKFDTYTARNGRRVGIQGDDGEKCWIVHSDDTEDLRRAIEALNNTQAQAPLSTEQGDGNNE